MSKCRPLGNRVVGSYVPAPEKTAGGIIIPETVKDEQKKAIREAIVLELGNGKVLNDGTLVTPPVKTGDHILYDKFGATGFELHGEKYVVIDCDYIIGIYE